MTCLCAHEFADCPIHPLLIADDDWVEPDPIDVAEHVGFLLGTPGAS